MERIDPDNEQSRNEVKMPDRQEPGADTAFEKAFPAQNEAEVTTGDDTAEARSPDTAGVVQSSIEKPSATSEELPDYQVLDYKARARMQDVMDRAKPFLGVAINKAGDGVRRTREFIRDKRYDVTLKEEAAMVGAAALTAGTIRWVRGRHRGHRPYTPHMPNMPHMARARRDRNAVMRHLPGRKSTSHFTDLTDRLRIGR